MALGGAGAGAPVSHGPTSGDQSVDEITAQIADLLAGVEESQTRTNSKTVLEFKGQWHPKPNGAETGHGVVPKSWGTGALAVVSENDRTLATYGWAGGAALCLSNAFAEANAMEAQAQDLLDHGHSEDHPAVQCIRTIARATEEREAVMRKQWSDIDFQEGEANNQEVLSHLERDFATQVAAVATRQRANDAGFIGGGGCAPDGSPLGRPWYNIKVLGGTAVGKVYLSANIQRHDGELGELGLQGYDDGSGRQRWLLEEGPGGEWFHLRLAGGTSTDRRLLSVAADGAALELCGAIDGSSRQRWRLSGSQRSSAHVAKLTWFSIQPLGSASFLASDPAGRVSLAESDGCSGRERWLLPQWPGPAAAAAAKKEPQPSARSPTAATAGRQGQDEILTLVARCGGEGALTLADLSQDEMTRVLNDNRNLGAAIDLVGCYLKNYEIDKADRVCQRVEPLCRERGGLWLFKLLNFYSTVRMKQSRFQEALAMYEEYEQLIGALGSGYDPDKQWELFDTVYRNFGWIHCSLGNHEKAMHYFRRCVEVKKKNGVPPHWFDQWDLGKTHARLSVSRGNFAALSHSLELIKKGIELHQQVEEQDKVMLCKMLNSGGECASLLGDYTEDAEKAKACHEEAVRLHRRSYDGYVATLGLGKPLTGWCMEHLAGALRRLGTPEALEEAKALLVASLRVECSKDIIKLPAMERLLGSVLDAHRETGDQGGIASCQEPINIGLENLRRRRINEVEAGSYAALLRRIAQVLLAHSPRGNLAGAMELLEEAVGSAQQALRAPSGEEAARLLERLQGRAAQGGSAEAWAAARESPVFTPKAGDQEMQDIDPKELLGDLQQQLRQLREFEEQLRTDPGDGGEVGSCSMPEASPQATTAAPPRQSPGPEREEQQVLPSPQPQLQATSGAERLRQRLETLGPQPSAAAAWEPVD